MALLKEPIHDEGIGDEDNAYEGLPQSNGGVLVSAGGAGLAVIEVVRMVVVVVVTA
jgi:hypothetical protein